MYDDDLPAIDARCNMTQHATLKAGRIGTGKRPQATNRLGDREGVYPNVFNLRMGEFLRTVGLLVAATMIAALEEA